MERGYHRCWFDRAVRLTLVAVVCFLAPRFVRGADDDRARDDELIRIQLFNDMLEGADDYFGEYNDLSYSDRVTPTEEEATPEPEPVSNSSGGGGKKETAPPPEVVPEEPPPPEPPPEEPPPPPPE